MTPLLLIQNKGPEIISTNFWDNELAMRGLCYLTWNANTARLLLPDAMVPLLAEMRTAREVIISRGPWPDHPSGDGLELLFEDDSDGPFCVTLSAEQTDRLIPASQQGGGFDVCVWTREGEALTLPGKYRIVPTIPWLKSWK